MKRYGKLDVIEEPGSDKACVVLFHGYGADANDLVPLSTVLKPKCRPRWIFPNGFLQAEFGRAWFSINLPELEKHWREGNFEGWSKSKPNGLDRAASLASTMLDDLHIPRSNIVIGGFSQGAMLATELALKSTQPFAGLLILSGTLINANEWSTHAGQQKDFFFLQSHGRDDGVLPFALAERLNETLINSGSAYGEFLEFTGGHEIPAKIMPKISQFIDERLL